MLQPEEIIDQLEAAKGTNAKKAILEANKYNETFKKVLNYALDPYKVFNIKKLPNVPSYSYHIPWEALFKDLDYILQNQLRGTALQAYVQSMLMNCHESQSNLLSRIILKDLRCGVATSTVNKVWKGLIPEFLVGLADSYEEKRAKFPLFVEIKWDGYRCVAFCDKGEVTLRSRNGLEIEGYDHIKQELKARFPQATLVLDGELMLGMFGSRKEKESSTLFRVFDIMRLDEWEAKKATLGLWARKLHLYYLLAGDQMPEINTFDELVYASDRGEGHVLANAVMIVESHEELMEVYNQAVSVGHEGVMVKDPEGAYEWDRSYTWMKVKPVKTIDLEIVGVYSGEAGKQHAHHLGGLTVDFNGVKVDVGGGYSNAQRAGFWLMRDELIGKTAEIKYTEVTPDGSLRFPRFVKIRDDK